MGNAISTVEYGVNQIALKIDRQEVITVLSGVGAISAGQELGMVTATGKWKKWDSTKTDGTEVFRAVAMQDIDATSADTSCVVLKKGEVDIAKLKTITTTSYQAIAEAADKGIYLVSRN
jgi:hypothetical protein